MSGRERDGRDQERPRGAWWALPVIIGGGLWFYGAHELLFSTTVPLVVRLGRGSPPGVGALTAGWWIMVGIVAAIAPLAKRWWLRWPAIVGALATATVGAPLLRNGRGDIAETRRFVHTAGGVHAANGIAVGSLIGFFIGVLTVKIAIWCRSLFGG